MAHTNPYGKVGYHQLSPYVQRLLSTSGGGSGIEGGRSVYTDRSYQIITRNTSKVKINLNTYNPLTDDVLIFQNGAFMTLGLDYTLNSDKSISPVTDLWRASEAQPMIFDFYCIGNITSKTQTISYVTIHILSTDSGWVQEGDLYTKLVAHNLNSTNIIVTGVYNDNRRSLQEVYDIVDSNTIKIYNEQPVSLSLTIVDVISSTSGPDATQGISMTINPEDFTYDDTEKMYKAVVNHALNTENILLGIKDSNNRSVYLSFYTIDKDNIYLYNTTNEILHLSILPLS